MQLIRKADDLIMSHVFEPVAWRLESRWKVNNFQLARVCLFVGILAWLSFSIARGDPQWRMAIGIAVATLLFIKSYRDERRANSKFRNRERDDIFPLVLRLVMLPTALGFFIAPLFTTRWVGATGSIMFWCYMGFLACNPMPPGFESRERQLITNPQA